ncbi:MAG: DUF1015 domain-containing protein [Chloroflexota bacterium]
MAEVRPFRGLRFDPSQVDLSAVVCPPYDVISPTEQQAYHARDAHNIVRVELGLAPTDPRVPGNRYALAADALARWRQEGILVPDGKPAMYLYEQQFSLGDRPLARRGLLVAGRLHDWSEGAVLPHEGTRAGPKEDRLALLRATETNVSPLWLLYDDGDGRVGAAVAAGWEQALDGVAESGGERHTLRVVDEPAALRAVVDAFAGRPLYIADGHHRYETAQIYRDERRQAAGQADPDAGYEFALMLLVALDDPGLVVLPTHRLVRNLDRSPDEVREALARWLSLTLLTLPDGDDAAVGSAVERAVAEAGKRSHAFALYERGGAWLLRPRDDVDWRALLPGGHSDAWQGLDVAMLDALVIRGPCGISAEGEAAHADATSHAPSDKLAYVSNVAGAVTAVRSGEADQAYFLNPTRVEQVCAVAAAGDRMPPKSTYFVPKPVTGLVLHLLDGTRPRP